MGSGETVRPDRHSIKFEVTDEARDRLFFLAASLRLYDGLLRRAVSYNRHTGSIVWIIVRTTLHTTAFTIRRRICQLPPL